MNAVDDLGYAMRLDGPARRVVSLVPSLTESVAATRLEALVGATDWCTHPADLDVPRVRGTKNPDRRAIAALRPDLVLANQEENRRTDVEALRASGIAVWVTVIESVPQALASMRRMFTDGLQWPVPSWLDEADAVWAAPPPQSTRTSVIAIWRDPWMVVGRDTFTGDLAARVGLTNLYARAAERYPHVELGELVESRPDVVVLPDEPYRFSPHDGPEAFPDTECALVEGRLLTWYGPSLGPARQLLTSRLAAPTRKEDPDAMDSDVSGRV